MSSDKKYTQREAAIAVLKKAEEMLKGSELAKKYEGFKAVEASARESGASNPAAVAAAAGRKKYGKEAFQHAAAAGKKMGKNEENPDEKQDAQLGEDVEHLCEDHMLANKDAERKEGHKLVAKSDCMKCNLIKPSPASGQGTTLPASKSHDAWEMDKAELQGDLEELAKSMKMKKVLGGVGSPSTPVGRPDMGSGAIIVKGEDEGAGSKKIGYKPSKLGAEEKQPEKSDKAFEVEGKDHKSSDDPREAHQPAPGNNPKEEAEGNNPAAGDTPAIADHSADGKNTKGHLKLAKFIGRMEFKRSQKGSK